MQQALNSEAEQQRLRALESLNILDTPAEELFDRHTRLLQRLTNAPVASFSLVDADRIWYKSSQGMTLEAAPRQHSFCDYAIGQQALVSIEDTQAQPEVAQAALAKQPVPFRFYAGRPIKDRQGFCLGVLNIMDYQPRALSGQEAELLENVAELIEYDIHLAQQATLDPLTGLSNHRGLLNSATHILALCDRSQCEATLVSFDLLDLGKINSEHGHEAGDLSLTAFARLLLDTFRACDVISRVEGGQFIVLLSHGDNVDILMPIRRFLIKLRDFNDAVQSPQMLNANISYVHYEKKQHGSVHALLSNPAQRTNVDNESLLDYQAQPA